MKYIEKEKEIKTYLQELGFSPNSFYVGSGERASNGFFKLTLPDKGYDELKHISWGIKYVAEYNFYIVWKVSPMTNGSRRAWRKNLTIKAEKAIAASREKKAASKYVNHTGGARESVWVFEINNLKKFFKDIASEGEKQK